MILGGYTPGRGANYTARQGSYSFSWSSHTHPAGGSVAVLMVTRVTWRNGQLPGAELGHADSTRVKVLCLACSWFQFDSWYHMVP